MMGLAFALLSVGQAPACPAATSYLGRPRFCEDQEVHGPYTPYHPQPGDIMMSADGSTFWKVMHNLGGTSHPTHSAIVFQRCDGSMAILEGGPHDTLRCRALPWHEHLCSYEREGRVWIRRRAVPLTAEQSACLTRFAEETDGKRFGIGRLGVQLTPFRTRGPLRTEYVGKPYGNRNSYFCSELVMEACVSCGLLDPTTTRPSATYPRDIFFDSSLNPYLNKHLKLAPCWDPPARWHSCLPEAFGAAR